MHLFKGINAQKSLKSEHAACVVERVTSKPGPYFANGFCDETQFVMTELFPLVMHDGGRL